MRSQCLYNEHHLYDGENSINALELRALQAPLKKQYKERPKSALYTLNAKGAIGENVTCNVETSTAVLKAGLHPATGGDGTTLCSGDMLLEALVACSGVTLASIATAMSLNIRGCTVYADGDLDFRGTLGVGRDVPVGFQRIRLRFELDTDATDDQLATLQRLTERYCVVYQTLRQPPQIDVSRTLVHA